MNGRESLGGRESTGLAPRGMWWVAWRQHRLAVFAGLAAIAVTAGAVFAYYLWLDAAMRAAGCVLGPADAAGCSTDRFIGVLTQPMQQAWNALTGALIVGPLMVGGFAAASAFAREFERGTYILVLTQSVGRLRWWATKCAVLGVPILAGLVGLGFVTQWVEDRTAWFGTGGALADGAFQIRGIMPAAYGLVGLAVALTAGLLIRSTIPALVVSLLVAGTIVILVGFPLRPHLLTPTRVVEPIGSATPPDAGLLADSGRNDWNLGSGYLNAEGKPVPFVVTADTCPQLIELMSPDASSGPDHETKAQAAFLACQTKQGIVASYTEYLPAGKAWPLQLVQTAICATIAAAFLAVGYLRLRLFSRTRLPGRR